MPRRPVSDLTHAALRLAGLATIVAAGVGACAVSFDGYHLKGESGGGGGAGGAGPTSSSGSTGGMTTASSSTSAGGTTSSTGGQTTSSTTSSSSTTTSTTSGGSCTGMLDPGLVIPSMFGQMCKYPGDGACNGLQYCRIAGPCNGYCESCTSCSAYGTPCSATKECVLGATCYNGVCTQQCPLSVPDSCANNKTCLNVGNDKEGVCPE